MFCMCDLEMKLRGRLNRLCLFVLPALLQLMAASEAGRDVAYFTFGDERLMRDVHALYTFLKDNCVTVGKRPATCGSFCIRSDRHYKNGCPVFIGGGCNFKYCLCMNKK